MPISAFTLTYAARTLCATRRRSQNGKKRQLTTRTIRNSRDRSPSDQNSELIGQFFYPLVQRIAGFEALASNLFITHNIR